MYTVIAMMCECGEPRDNPEHAGGIAYSIWPENILLSLLPLLPGLKLVESGQMVESGQIDEKMQFSVFVVFSLR